MNCPYCRASNLPDDHRCQRCGRRLDTQASARPVYGRGATARALQWEPEEETENEATPALTGAQSRRNYQPALFSTRIVSFESNDSEAVEPQISEPKELTPSLSRLRLRSKDDSQDHFSFDTLITQSPQAPPVLEPAIVCNERVAMFSHRCTAAAIDLSLVIVALGLFLLIFWLGGGQMALTAHAIPLCLGMAAVIYLMYELLWCMANLDTAGMRWAHLRLVDFDGQKPDREQRLVRAASGCLSVLSAGLGILWVFVDEESLAWHDHISKTFPTPY